MYCECGQQEPARRRRGRRGNSSGSRAGIVGRVPDASWMPDRRGKDYKGLSFESGLRTVGPVYSGIESDRRLLEECYRNSLILAKQYDIHSIAFPAISTGVYGYPLDEAAPIAAAAVAEWMEENPDYEISVIFSCFDRRTCEVYEKLMG